MEGIARHILTKILSKMIRFIIKTVHIKQKIKQTCIKIKIRNLKIKMLQSLQNNKDYCNMEIDCMINEKVIKS